MREATFTKLNLNRWKEFEQVLNQSSRPSPGQLEEMFIQLTDDLAFAATQFPESRTAKYLNGLTSRIHLEIYRNKREEKGRIWRFWKYEVPSIMYQQRRHLFYSLVIFSVAALVGVVSILRDDTFVRLILGDGYVDMTLENIKNGNPMGVFSQSDSSWMFFFITFNNIRVAFITFVLGAFVSVGTALELIQNGMMVGVFLTFFFTKGLLAQSASVIMLHGTIELSSIVIAGGAGLVMGNSLLFPGTYSRLVSFQKGGIKGLKMVVALVPFFIIAGFIESFITRYAHMPAFLKATIILGSAALIIYYFIVYPIKLHRNGKLILH